MDRKIVSSVFSSVLPDAKILEIEELDSGWLSTGYKVITSTGDYFIKEIETNHLGFEIPERKIYAAMVSHRMNVRWPGSPRSIGVVKLDSSAFVMPEVGEDTKVFEVQEYGGDGKNLYSDFRERRNKEFGPEDILEIKDAVAFISKIHAKRCAKDSGIVYNDYLRMVIGQPEYTLQLMQSTPLDEKTLSFDKQIEMVTLMLKFMISKKDNASRCVALHGDFWVANCILRPDGTRYYIDYSRMPYGDAGFDIGFWCSSFVFNGIETGSKYYLDYVTEFLRQYEKTTGDKDIREHMIYPMAMLAIAYAKQDYVPGYSDRARTSILEYVISMMKAGEFSLPQIESSGQEL